MGKNVLRWILVILLACLGLLNIANPAGFLFLLAAILVIPLEKIQDLLQNVVEKYGRAFLFLVVIFGAILLSIPEKEVNPASTPTEPTISAPTVSTTQTPTDAPTQSTMEESTEVPTEAPTEKPTEEPTEEPTQASTEIPTEMPTQPPTVSQTEPNEQTGIVFISWPETIQRGTEGTVTIQGLPNTSYRIQVYYKSGPSTAAGLEEKISDENGYVTWTWKVSSRTGIGTFKIVVSGGEDSAKVEYSVTE